MLRSLFLKAHLKFLSMPLLPEIGVLKSLYLGSTARSVIHSVNTSKRNRGRRVCIGQPPAFL